MDLTKLTFGFLVVSALVFGGMLTVRLVDHNRAEATAMAVSGNPTGAFEYVTAKTEQDVNSLFVLHKDSHMLLVYKPRTRGGRSELNPVGHYDLRRLMGTGQRGGQQQRGGGHTPR